MENSALTPSSDDPDPRPQIQQNLKGNDNQAIGEMKGGSAIGKIVGNVIYNYYYREEVKTAIDDAVASAEADLLPCPYRGLFHFGPGDAEYFFGRESFVEELVRATQTRNFIPVLGASGSGKSSVVLAGLVPKLQQAGHWQFTHFRPGVDPFHALALALVPLYTTNLDETERIRQARNLADYFRKGEVLLADVFAQIQQNYPNDRVLLIADQFEELYTLCTDEATRRNFLDKLLAGIPSPSDKTPFAPVLVATMRADFLGNALSYRPFADMLQNADLKLGPMNQDELTDAIEKPAQKLGVTFAEGLVERILGDVDKEPGILPLLEFALTELWQRRSGKQLTHAAYEEIGEVQGALARHANQEFDKLSETDREQVRRIFIQLVRPGEGTEDTRRIAMKAELEKHWSLVKRLADARLVVTSRNATNQETVEVVHEALISNWGELRGWMDKDRVFRAWQERLRAAMRQWQEMQQDEGSLLRGAALAEAEEQLRERPEELISESDFIEQSLQERERLKQAEANRRKREIRTAWGIAAGSLVAVVVSTGLGAVAFLQYKTANQQKEEAVRQGKIALARQLATQADLKGDKGNLQEFSALDESSQKFTFKLGLDSLPPNVVSLLRGIKPRILRFSPDRKLIAVTDDKFLHFFQIDSGQEVKVQEPNIINAMNFSPDGKTLATAGEDATLTLWSVETGKKRRALVGHSAPLTATAFSPDGRLIVTGSLDKTIKLWDLSGGEIRTLHGHTDVIYSAVFSPDARYILTGGQDHTARLWDKTGRGISVVPHDGSVRLAVFTPDGESIATVSGDTVVRMYSIKELISPK